MPKTENARAKAIDVAAIEANLRPQSTEKIRFRFFECYGNAAELLAEAAVCVKLLKERGDNLNGLPMIGTFLRVASGQVLPELLWKFIDSPNRQRVERLPLDDQRRISSDPVVPVVEANPKGGFTKRMVDLTRAPADVANLIAGPDGIRSVEEQMAHLGALKARPAASIKALERPDATEPLDHQMSFRVTASELEAVRIHAAIAGLTERDTVRQFLLRSGAFKRPKT